MDEVDNIIMHQLHQIDAGIDATLRLSSFTPELVVRAVSSCLHETITTQLPRSLPANMAQRFSVATALAECCQENGYRGDIGYQTFLYPNPVELRRLLMFLIEKLPRERDGADQKSSSPLSASELLHREIHKKLAKQLKAPWVPPFCRTVANRRSQGCSSLCIEFQPQLNLNVPGAAATERAKEVQQYFELLAPNVFQQTASSKYDLIASVLHKNDLERWGLVVPDSVTLISAAEDSTNVLLSPERNIQQAAKTLEPTVHELLADSVQELRSQCQDVLSENKSLAANMAALKTRETEAATELGALGSQLKLHERTCLVLADPEENLTKLEALLRATEAKRETLTKQWQDYRDPLLNTLQKLKTAKEAQHMQSMLALRLNIEDLEQQLRSKTQQHSELNVALRNATDNQRLPRKEYTRRIHEFIGNIGKQRADILKVLDDTRQLQKQLNVVGSQLQRQFNYTDDLLFQSAKHDLHAKKAYKLLAQLHANCNDLVECVSLTGNVTKEIRELEVQIDGEKLKNIITSLQQITGHIQELQNEIRTVEHAITAANDIRQL